MGISNEMPCALASNENERLREVRNVGPFPTFTHDRRRDAALAPHRDFSDATPIAALLLNRLRCTYKRHSFLGKFLECLRMKTWILIFLLSLLQAVCGQPDKEVQEPTVVQAVSVDDDTPVEQLQAEARSSDYEDDDLLAVESNIAESRESFDSYSAPQAPGGGYGAPAQDSYGSPAAPEEDSYGAPQAPPEDSYGAPQAPVESYGAPEAPPQQSYGGPIPVPLPVPVKPGSIVIPQGPPPKKPPQYKPRPRPPPPPKRPAYRPPPPPPKRKPPPPKPQYKPKPSYKPPPPKKPAYKPPPPKRPPPPPKPQYKPKPQYRPPPPKAPQYKPQKPKYKPPPPPPKQQVAYKPQAPPTYK